MNKEKLTDSCKVLEKTIIEVAKLYNSADATSNQKALLETMIGAAIWYLPSSAELYSGYISARAIDKVKEGTPVNKLTQEHRFPRKQAGKLLLSETYKKFIRKEASLYELYVNEFGKFNLVVKNENRDLIPFQGESFVDHITSYNDAGIKLVKMSMDEIKRLLPKNAKQYSKEEKPAEEGMMKDQRPPLHTDRPEITKLDQQANNSDDGKGYDFSGINLNGEVLLRGGNVSKCYRAYMNYVIDHFEGQMKNSVFIKNLIRLDRNAPEFGTDPVKYPYVIIAHGKYFYNVHSNSSVKKNRIIKIASELGMALEFFYE
jgi:hypothetical protein